MIDEWLSERLQTLPMCSSDVCRLGDAIAFLSRTAWPLVDLLIRIWIGERAIVLSLLVATDWAMAASMASGGVFVATAIRSKLRGEPVAHAFSYRHMGSLATIGRKSAVADFGFVRLRGPMASWLWGIAHVLFLLGSRNRVAVVLNWIWFYVTYGASTRLITGSARNGEEMMSR